MKKELPLSLIKKFKPEYGDNIKKVRPESADDKFIILFQDVDPLSNFFFRIDSYQQNRSNYVISYRPKSEDSVEVFTGNMNVDQVGAHFDKWHNLILEYDEAESFLDDPILKSHSENYYDEFELLEDDDQASKPLTAKQMLLLNEHLEEIEKGIENYRSDDNSEAIDQIINESKELRDNLSKRTKKQIVKSLSWIWAKMTKESVPIVKEFLNEAKRRAITSSINHVLDVVVDTISKGSGG